MTQSGPTINNPDEEKHLKQAVQGVFHKAIETLLPERCFSCGEIVATSGGLCGACWGRVTFIAAPQCRRCGRPFEFDAWGDIECAECLRRPPVYDKARSCMVYDAASRGVILAFKHADRMEMAPEMAAWLARAGEEVIARADLIAPVPLHWTRLWARKFNQSAELARHLARSAGKPFAPDIIRRKRRTPSQAGLGARDRARNVRGAFALSKKAAARVAGQQILLVDDVMTTGSTLNACAGVLLWAGATGVDVLTLARVVRAEQS